MHMPSRWTTVAPMVALALVPEAADHTAVSTRHDVAPTIVGISPRMVSAGAPAFRLLVTGTQFASAHRIRFNGVARATTFLSGTALATDVSAADVATPRLLRVTVLDPSGDSTISNEAVFTVGNPMPVLASLAPSSGPLLGEAFTLTVNGSSFVPSSVVRWNGVARTTTFVGATRLQASIPASALAGDGIAAVTVSTPGPGGGTTSPDTFRIALATPGIATLTPNRRQVGLGQLTLRITGSNFIRSSLVRWNGSNRPTTWLSPSQLDATIPATDVDQIASVPVTVQTVVPNVASRTSQAATFDVASPATTLSGPPIPMPLLRFETTQVTHFGSGFSQQTVVTVNGAPRPTTLLSANSIRVSLFGADIDGSDLLRFGFVNPSPTLGTAIREMTVMNPVPVATAASPKSVLVGGAEFTLTVTGNRFVPGAEVRVNGVRRDTRWVSRSELRATIPADDLKQGGDMTITVFNPGPGGGTSTGSLYVTRLHPQIIVK